jgi:endonuclease/exonuclease/phosphatase family metal-dependent hydrolase
MSANTPGMQALPLDASCEAENMNVSRKYLLLAVLILSLVAATILPSRAGRKNMVTIATWNLEWLVSPPTAHAGRLDCRSGRRASLPCDVAEEGARDSADLARLATYARRLDADIVAFQEVENEAIARKVFGGYRICMADGGGVQHVGFAIRPGVLHRCGPAEESLSVEGRTRKAMTMQLLPERGNPIELLVVHLKSGCSRDPLDSAIAACRLLAQQAQHLGEWIAQRDSSKVDFIVLGDFNRVPPDSPGDAFWENVQTAASELVAGRLPFRNCFVGQPFSAFIDHLLLSSNLIPRIVPGTLRHSGYEAADAVRYHLSDHCPVSISLTLDGNNRPPDELSSVAR